MKDVLKQRRTCYNCKANESGSHSFSHYCSIGFNTDGKEKPLDPCPKPLSTKALFEYERGKRSN